MALPTTLMPQQSLDDIVRAPTLTVVAFVAGWSENSKPTKELTREFLLDTDFRTVEFVEVEAEDHPDLCNKLNITSVPVVIFFKSGVEIERLTGGNVRHYAAKVALNRTAEVPKGLPTPPVITGRPVTAPAGGLKNPGDMGSSGSSAEDLTLRLGRLVKQAKVMVFMKGNPQQPRCGFSRKVIALINETGLPYETFDILEDEEVRQGLKGYSNWQTYPQIYVEGELLGGLDVLQEMKDSGSLMNALMGIM